MLMVENSSGFAWLTREDLPVVIAVAMGRGLCGAAHGESSFKALGAKKNGGARKVAAE